MPVIIVFPGSVRAMPALESVIVLPLTVTTPSTPRLVIASGRQRGKNEQINRLGHISCTDLHRETVQDSVQNGRL